MNKVILVGNLTRDVELKIFGSGGIIGVFAIACSHKWKDKHTGDIKEDVMFVDVKLFGRRAEVAQQYLGKGKKVLVEGRLVLDQWQDQNGQKRSKHSISCENFEFLEPKGSVYSEPRESIQQQTAPTPPKNNTIPSNTNSMPDYEITDDDIPF
jgi:single-strand DNA-binding protein